MASDLLSDPLFSVSASGIRSQVSLAGALAGLSRASLEFSALQRHQGHAWHALLTQLAALALLRAGETTLPTEDSAWRALLLALTDGAREPWSLIVEDLSKAAFLQPPVPEGSVASWSTVARPDEIDVLVTTKNHDVKRSRIRAARAEHWVFVLASLQGTQGFSGRGNYGVARMNGGFGSRPCITAVPELDAGPRFRRDVSMLLAHHEALAPSASITRGAPALLWLVPWDGEKQLSLEKIDPLFIEVCRRVRLVEHDGVVTARKTASKAARIAAKESMGNTHDAWTPVASDDGAALTVSGRGFHYSKLHELLFPEDNGWKAAPAQEVRRTDGAEPWFYASAMVRGQGVTEGYHERVLPLARVSKGLGDASERKRLATRAKNRVTMASDVRLRVLRPALLVLVQAGPDKLKADDKRMDRWTDRFDQLVDEVFFERLFDSAQLSEDAAGPLWAKELLTLAASVLSEAIEATPLPGARRYRAIAHATTTFRRCANSPKNGFAGLLERTPSTELGLRSTELSPQENS